MIRNVLATLALGTAVAAVPANAAPVFSFEGGLASPAPGFAIVNNFNGPNAASSVTGSGYQILTGNLFLVGAPPANTSPTGTAYLAVQGGGSATYSFGGTGVDAFSFDWGSIDTFNTLTVNYVGGSTSYTPGNGFLLPADGSQGAAATNGRATLRGERFTSVTFASSSSSFEVDNIAAVPEPATWAMMVLGFGVIGFGMRRRKSVKTTVQFA